MKWSKSKISVLAFASTLLITAVVFAGPFKDKAGRLFDWYIGGTKVMEIDNSGTLKVDAIESLSGGSTVGAVPSGGLVAFAGSSVPTGWLACDGTAVSRTTYAGLFASIGTTWGVGDGSTTFNLPQLGGRILRGAGAITDGQGGDTVALGAFQDDETAPNGLSNSTSTVSGIAGTNVASSISGSTGGETGHTHSYGRDGGRIVPMQSGAGGREMRGELDQSSTTGGSSGHSHASLSGTAAAQSWSQSGTGTAASQTISGDNETRPKSYGVNYIIKI